MSLSRSKIQLLAMAFFLFVNGVEAPAQRLPPAAVSNEILVRFQVEDLRFE